jgi:ATP-binding cassette subfamily F protein 3
MLNKARRIKNGFQCCIEFLCLVVGSCMPIQLQNITFSFPTETLFEELTWQVTAGERYGLVGPNGAGKTTLLKLLSGELSPDSGVIVRPKGVRVGYLSQAPILPSNETTVREILLRPLAYLQEAQRRMEEIHGFLDDVAHGRFTEDEASKLAEELGHLEEKFRQGGGYALDAKMKELLWAFGLPPEETLTRKASTLSGGEKSRVMLAEILLSNPDLLLLDEPTNHLDIEGTEHLEELLSHFAGAVVIISHDRYLLDHVVRQIVEVDGGELNFYTGGYTVFMQERAKRLAQAREAYERQREEIERQEDFIRKNIAGQKTAQAKGRRKLLARVERLERPDDVWAQASNIGLSFSSGGRAPKIVAEANQLTKAYENKTILSDVSVVITRGEKVGIIGPNGGGKSTLLKCMIGKITPDQGSAGMGIGVSLGYLDQEVADKVSNQSAIEELMDLGSPLGLLTNVDATRQYLSRFRFFGDDAFRSTKGFSGGERTRLALAKIMLTAKNTLALDEPTNHLDIPTREVLENTLKGYDGTLIVVSHDRYFLDQVVSKIIRIENGKAETFLGNYSEWKQKAAPSQPKEMIAERKDPRKGKETAEEREARNAREKDRKKIEKKLQETEVDISALETQIGQIEEKLAKDSGDNWNRLNDLTKQQKELQRKLDEAYAEWERLGALLAS